MTLVIAIMSITRHQVRALYLEPATAQFQVQIVPQWGNFVLFALLLVAGLATNLLGPRHQINLLASPVLGILASAPNVFMIFGKFFDSNTTFWGV